MSQSSSRSPLLAVLLLCFSVFGQNSAEFFESQIRPILATRCYACHTGSESGGLRLDSREGLLKGGKSGPAIVPGKPDDSLLIQATTYQHARLKMPPAEKLENSEIAALNRWVKEGAEWPANSPVVVPAGPKYNITAQQRAFWAFRPVKAQPPPVARLIQWRKNPVDAFVLAKLDEKKLTPARAAPKLTRIRRATLYLTGLPPTPE